MISTFRGELRRLLSELTIIKEMLCGKFDDCVGNREISTAFFYRRL